MLKASAFRLHKVLIFCNSHLALRVFFLSTLAFHPRENFQIPIKHFTCRGPVYEIQPWLMCVFFCKYCNLQNIYLFVS